MPVGKTGVCDLVDYLLLGHTESLRLSGEAAFCDISLDRIERDLTALLKDDLYLLREERDVVDVRDMFA